MKKNDKASAILDAAAHVFMESGFAAASLDDISEAYGATKGIIYYHFKNKSALFFAVQRRAMEMTRRTFRRNRLRTVVANGQSPHVVNDATPVVLARGCARLRAPSQ